MNHKMLALRLLKLLEMEGRTYISGLEVDRQLREALSRSSSRSSAEGLVEAKAALMLPLWIMAEAAKGASADELRKSFPRWEVSLAEGWDQCVLALREVAGEIPSTLQERDRAMWVQHWRFLWASNRRNEAEGKFFPENTATDEAILAAAKTFYPDLDLREITGGPSSNVVHLDSDGA